MNNNTDEGVEIGDQDSQSMENTGNVHNYIAEKINLLLGKCDDVKNTDSGISLCQLCDNEGEGVYKRVMEYINDTDISDIKIKIENDTDRNWLDNIDHDHSLENVLILKTYIRLKGMEKRCLEYRDKHKKYTENKKKYKKDEKIVEIIYGINTNNIEKTIDVDYNDIIRQIFTPHKINQELLSYELIFYKFV